jgi:hypothetical protein
MSHKIEITHKFKRGDWASVDKGYMFKIGDMLITIKDSTQISYWSEAHNRYVSENRLSGPFKVSL